MPQPNGLSPSQIRARAALALHAVECRRKPLDALLGATPPPLLMELAYGACRRYFSLRAEVDARLARPLRARDQMIRALLVIGLYQLRHTRIPAHAAVAETVAAAAALKRPWARRLANAVLRRLAEAPAPTCAAQRWDHPDWMLRAFAAGWPQDCPGLFEANNARAPMALRVNVARTSVAAYRRALDAAELSHRVGLAPATLVLDAPIRTDALPGYADGLASVQDEGAQLAATLLPLRAGERLLDACAAPGGKAFHLLEAHPNARIVALDASAARAQTLRDEGKRLGHRLAHVWEGDATSAQWWDGAPFGAILLDAPCSGTGTLRRHPDIKVSRRSADVARAAQLQRAMLDNLWPMLSRGGALLYCTCSILPQENDAVVKGFLQNQADAALAPLNARWGRRTPFGRALLPTPGGADGFYYARLRKT